MRCNTTRMARNGQPDVKVLCYVMLTIYSYWSECLTMCVDAAIESAGASQSPQPQMSHQQSPYHNSAATQQAHQFDGAPPRLPAVDGATHTSSRPSGQQHQQLGVHSSSSSSSNSSPMSASSAGDELSESNTGIANNLVFEPSQLNFHELPMGSANTEMVTVFNRHPNRTVSIGPISGVLPDFYSHFFDDQIKVIEPLSNTSFSVVYLPQQLGPVSSELHVHSTFGTRRFELLGTATECPFRMQPLVGIRTALNATLVPEIVMYNPYAVPLQVLEVYSSGGHFKVWLPGGRSGTEAPRHIWEIAPHSERSVVQVSFRATVAGNYSAYLRIMVVDESSQVDDMELVLPMQFEVTDQLGLFAEQPFLHFGRAGRQDRPKRVIINLADSAAYNYRSMAPSIQSYAVEGDAALIEAITLRVHGGRIGQAKAAAASADEFNMGGFRVMPPAVSGDGALPATGDDSEPETMDNRHSRVMSAELDWAKLTAYHIYRGHIAIRTLLNNNQEANLRIALVAVALEGSMFYNESHTQFVTAKMDTPLPNVRARDFVVRNDFTVPLVINNVSLGAAASQHFRTSDFGQQVLAAGQQATVFRIEPLPAAVRQPTVAHMRLHTNASTYEIRLASYDGLLRRIVPIDERTTGGIGTDELAISFGTLPLATVTDTTVAFVNDNPVPVTIHNWTATISEAASIFVILRGCSQLSMDGLKFCYSVQPGEWIVFQVSVMSNAVGTFVGRLTLRTDYEELQTPVRFNTAVGKLHISATETDERQCFPGGVCSLNLTAHSTFVLPITVREILVNVTGITYDYSHARQLPPVVPNRAAHIARLHFHPRSICGDECYLQLPDRWAPSVISHNCKHQLPDLMHAKLEEFRRIRAAFATLAIRVQTNQVRRFDFNGSASILWPKLVTMPRSRTSTSHAGSGSSSGAATAASPAANSAAAFGSDGDADSGSGSDTDATGARMDAQAVDVDGDIDNRGPIEFPTFQVGEEVLRIVEVTNPSDRPIAVHLMLHDMVRHGATMSLPPEVMSSCWDCFLSREQVFALVDTATVRPSELQVIAPRASVHVTVRFSTQNAGTYSNLLYVRNNFTILEAVWLTAKAAAHQFKFGNRKPGSDTPLVFELTEKHFRDCDRGHRAAAERKSSTALGELATAFADGISGISVGEAVADDATDEQQRVRVVARRTFTAKNTGDIPIDIFGMYIEGIKCFAYGFKVMNCWNFRLPPDTTKKIEITFTPDFTLARVSRVLSIETSLNYPINYTLLSLVPAQALNTCGKAIERPTWEYGLQLVVFVALGLLLLLVMCQAFIDADRLLKEHAFNVSRDRGPTEPTLNLREVGLRNPIVEEAIGLAAAIDGSAADAPAGGAQKQLAAIASNGHGNGGGGGNGRSVRKRNAKRTESNDQLQQQLQPQQPAPSPSHQPPHKLLPVLEAKSWVNVLVRKASLFKTDVQFIEPTATPPPHNRSADNNKKDAPSVISGKRNVVAMMDANLPALAEAQNRTDDASSIGSTGSSTPSSNGSGKSSTGPANKKSASYASPATATSNSNKRNLNMPLDMPSGGTQSNASSNQPTSTTTSTTSSSSSNPGQAAASNSNVASNVATPSISKTKSKALVKKTKSCPLQMPAQPTLLSVAAVTAASPASTATTSTNAKVGKHHTPTEPASTTQHNHVKLEGRAPACTSSADAAAVDTRKMDNNSQQNTKPSAFNQNHTIAESSTPNNIKSPVSNHNHTMSSTPAAAAVPPTQQSIKTPVSNHNHTIASPQAAAAKVPSAPNNAKSPATNHNVPAKPPAAVQSAQFNTKSSSANHNNTVPSTSAATSTKSSLPTIIKAADQNAVSTPSVAVASLPSVSLPDASSLSPADAFETEKSPTGAIKKYGKTPGRERRKDAPPPVTRKQNLNSALAGDHKPSTGALFFKSHAFQFNSLMGSATPPQQQPQQPQPQQTPTSFANFAPPVPTVKTSSAAPATSTVWDMNKATFSNVVAQSTISALPPMTQTATLISNVTLPRSTAPEKVSQINSANKASMATKPTEDAPNDATTSSLFSDPVPTITQSRNKISAPDGNNIESTALALDRAPLSSSTEGAKFRSSAERASGERQPFVDVDNQAAGYNHGPIGTRKSPVWEPLQESLLNSLYGLNATGNHLADNSMGNIINGHNETDASMGNGHDIGPHNPNSFFSSNFPQYNRSAYDLISGAAVTDDHGQRVTSTSPIAALQRQPPNLDLGGLSGLSDIFGSTRNVDFASNASAPSAIERSANLWDTPIGEIGVCNLKILFEQQQLQQQHHLQQQQQLLQQQQQQQLNQQQQNAMMSIATLSDLLSTNQFAGQAAALNNFNHHQSQQQLQQQLHYSTMQSHQPITSTIASTSGAALFADQSNLWSTQYNTAGVGQSGSQPTWGTALQYQQQQQQQLQLRQQHQQQQPHQLGAIRPPPGLEFQPFPHRLYNQQQMLQQLQQQQQQIQPQQQFNDNQHNLSGIGDLAVNTNVNNAMHNPVNNGSNNAFNAYNGLSSLWDPPVRPSTSNASLHSNHSAASPPPPPLPDLNRSM